jgi:hypothetical protein
MRFFLLKLPTITKRFINEDSKLKKCMHTLNKLTENLIPKNVVDSPLLSRKAKILTYIHLFTFGIAVLSLLLTLMFTPANDSVSLIGAFLATVVLLCAFKQSGNLALSGNLLAGLWVVVIMPVVPFTRGLYSDNLLWLIIEPLIPLLVANWLSGVGWMLILEVFLYHVYAAEPINVEQRFETLRHFDNQYYFISYTLLTSVLFSVAS